jgi:hypothetical protein
MQGKNKYNTHVTIFFMFLFAGCNNEHIPPCSDKGRKHAKVKYSEYAKNGKYIAKGEYSECAKEAPFAKEGNNEPLPKRAMTNPLPRMGTGLGTTMSLLLLHCPCWQE